jgi:acetyltransferase-like isoleucine patch superfamily enzyme
VWHHAHVRDGAVIGADCTLGSYVYIDVGARVGDRVKIQNNVSVYQGVTLEDEVFVGPSAVFTNDRHPRAVGPWEVVPTLVRHGASIGANATVVCGVEVGEWAMVGAGAVVTRSVGDHELVVGNPARRVGWACACGRVAARTDARPADLRCEACQAAGVPAR